jgi:salicylate hydroxylase
MVNSQKADIAEMLAIFKDWDPKLQALLSIVQESSKWKLQNSTEMARWSKGKFVLMGDACHATLPYLAQGAAMAVEDGAVLGELFSKITHRDQLPDILSIYEKLRKPRTTEVVKGSTALRDVFHMHDGPRQQERDRQLTEFQEDPFVGFPNRWRDPVFQEWLFGYDVQTVVGEAWATYEKGRWPGLTGSWKRAKASL